LALVLPLEPVTATTGVPGASNRRRARARRRSAASVSSTWKYGTRFTAGAQLLSLPGSAPRHGELILGLRPEHTALSRNGAAGWPLKVEMIEMLGAERLVYGRLGDALFTVRVDGTLSPPQPGDVVSLQMAPEHLHWFDATTHQRVS